MLATTFSADCPASPPSRLASSSDDLPIPGRDVMRLGPSRTIAGPRFVTTMLLGLALASPTPEVRADGPHDPPEPSWTPEQRHPWSSLPPRRPEPPAVGAAAWVRNPIDSFILQQVEAAGLSPSPEADRATMIR